MGVQTQDIVEMSATSSLTPPPQSRGHKVEVVKMLKVITRVVCGYRIAGRPIFRS